VAVTKQTVDAAIGPTGAVGMTLAQLAAAIGPVTDSSIVSVRMKEIEPVPGSNPVAYRMTARYRAQWGYPA
jgi:hypothetical protein